MIKNLFKKQKKENQNDKYLPIIALLVHAAKIDEKYTETEKTIIKKVIMELNKISLDESKKILEIAEKAEEKSNQIVGFTSEIKKYSMEFRLKIIEIIGEDKLEDLDPETLHFITTTLNKLDLKKIRNNIIVKTLPNRV